MAELLHIVTAWLLVIVPGGILALALWLTARRQRRSLLPTPRRRAVPWSPMELCLAVMVYFVVPPLCNELLERSGFYTWQYGPDFPPLPPPGDDIPDAAHRVANLRRGLWSAMLAFPFQLLTVLAVLRLGSGTRLYQLGLTTHRFASNVLLGLLGLLAVPFIYLVYLFVLLWLPLESHSVTELARSGLSPVEKVLVVLEVTVAAAVIEELVYRGVLLKWLAVRNWGGVAAASLIVAFQLLGVMFGFAKLRPDVLLFVAAAMASYFPVAWLGWRWLPEPRVMQAIFGTSVLWAAVHPWPSPFPLFLLGLLLGFMAERTQSLVGPILLHGLFNGVACVLLLTQPGSPPENGKDETSALRRPVSVSTSTSVPGS